MKFKKIPEQYFLTILDRLTRFEPANIRYERVFCDIISKFYCDSISKNNLALDERIDLVEKIISNSISNDEIIDISDSLIRIENKYFNLSFESEKYLKSKINYLKLFDSIKNFNNLPLNVRFIKSVYDCNNDIEKIYDKRKQDALLYPLNKIILCEGQTEFVLLNTIFKKLNFDLKSQGILVLGAGGKNQVARKYYQMIEYTKLPFFILLDKDANEIKDLIKPKLRDIDKLYLINKGEFEDIIPVMILMKTINYNHQNDFECVYDDFFVYPSMVKNLDQIYRKYGFGEFKKAHFALEVNKYIENKCSFDDFKTSELVNIVKTLQDM